MDRPRRLATLFSVFLFSGCGITPPAPPPQPAQSKPTSPAVEEINRNLGQLASQTGSFSGDYRIGPEDLLQITLYNIPEQGVRVTPRNVTVRVTHQGHVTLPLLGELSVKGMTAPELERTLRKRYERYLYNPQVGVLVQEYRQRVSVIGAVQKPGVYELSGPKTVIDMLAMAGGLTDKSGNQVHVYRNDDKGKQNIVIDLSVLAGPSPMVQARDSHLTNMPVKVGDVINVPPAGMFFVDGAVAKPGSYPLGRAYTLTQALATAGGVDKELYASNVTIFRRQGPQQADAISVDLHDIQAGRAADPQIAPDDVIVVPVSSAKYFVKRFVGTIISGFSIGGLVGGS